MRKHELGLLLKKCENQKIWTILEPTIYILTVDSRPFINCVTLKREGVGLIVIRCDVIKGKGGSECSSLHITIKFAKFL